MIRTSHLIFIGFCIAWVSFVMITPSDLKDEVGYAETLGQALGSLVIPSMIYGGYLLLTRKKESKIKKTSV